VGDEFIGEDRGVGKNSDFVDSYGGDFGKDGAAEGVGEGEGCGLEDEVDAVECCLREMEVQDGMLGCEESRGLYFSNGDFWAGGFDVQAIVRVCPVVAVVGHDVESVS
jgi:hypothetical protein